MSATGRSARARGGGLRGPPAYESDKAPRSPGLHIGSRSDGPVGPADAAGVRPGRAAPDVGLAPAACPFRFGKSRQQAAPAPAARRASCDDRTAPRPRPGGHPTPGERCSRFPVQPNGFFDPPPGNGWIATEPSWTGRSAGGLSCAVIWRRWTMPSRWHGAHPGGRPSGPTGADAGHLLSTGWPGWVGHGVRQLLHPADWRTTTSCWDPRGVGASRGGLHGPADLDRYTPGSHRTTPRSSGSGSPRCRHSVSHV